MYNGFFIDIGCYDGIIDNYTYELEKKYNWSGVCIEADQDILPILAKNRPNSRCITSIVWASNTYLDFERKIQDPLSGRICNISHNSQYSDLVTRDLVSVNTLYKILKDHQIKQPHTIDCIALDINGAEIYILEYLLNKYPYNISNIVINYQKDFLYLKKLIERVKEFSQLSIDKIDHKYLQISKEPKIDSKTWISEIGLFSQIGDKLWYGYINEQPLEHLQQIDINEHCIFLSNSQEIYRICNHELYKLDNNSYLKMTNGRWIN